MMKTPTMLMILDGFGINPDTYGNAIKQANTPNLDRIFGGHPFTQINASGEYVGLPDGQMGNSEVGHLNIGAGRIVYQELTNITKATQDGRFFENEALNHAMDHVIENSEKNPEQALHLFGLMSDGGVHSHIDHIKAAIAMAKAKCVPNLYVHCFMDGRDVPPTSGINYIHEIENYMAKLQLGHVGMVSGRYYAMDRDKRWDRVEKAYDTLTIPGIVAYTPGSNAMNLVQASYDVDVTDEFILPAMTSKDAWVKDGDSIIFCNFRPDRARELTRAFVDPDFDKPVEEGGMGGFKRKVIINDLVYVCMTQYDAEMPNVEIAFPPKRLENTLGEYVSSLGLRQLRIAETEKYAHVTFFFNGGVEEPNPGEDRILVPSPKVATYDLQPEMSAPEVKAKVIDEIKARREDGSSKYDLIILNFANSDMVGHTGVMEAAVKAVETLDGCVAEIVDAITDVNGQLLITADHGNSDMMLDPEGNPFTAHTTNPVPLCYVGDEGREFNEYGMSGEGKLADLAPTLLYLMGIEIPEEMTGEILMK